VERVLYLVNARIRVSIADPQGQNLKERKAVMAIICSNAVDEPLIAVSL